MFENYSNIRRAEIVTIGNEIVSGMIADTNSCYLSEHLQAFGIDVVRITAVGDREEEIAQAIHQALERVDLVITTGGLGSTHDDITKPVLARLFGCGLRTDEKVAENLEKFFNARGKAVPPSVKSQSEVPEKAVVLYNEKGTAPGLLFEQGGKKLYALPGIPLEMEHLFEKFIHPASVSAAKRIVIRHRILHTTGLTEAELWRRVGPLEALEQLVTVASLPSHLGVRIRLSACGREDEVSSRLTEAENWMHARVADYIFGRDEETLEGRVGDLLRAKQLTLSVAESCTGGLVGHRLTQVPGSSDYFLEGAVTYSNDAKKNRLGVDEALLARFGAVSREVALAMAEGIRRSSGADIGLSVTGIAGPAGGREGKPVGLTFIAVSDEKNLGCERFVFHQDRVRNKERAAQAALNLLRLRLMKI
ncbi:MAG: competence/damage-inducible protein A [Nitrospinaceae bacterium]